MLGVGSGTYLLGLPAARFLGEKLGEGIFSTAIAVLGGTYLLEVIFVILHLSTMRKKIEKALGMQEDGRPAATLLGPDEHLTRQDPTAAGWIDMLHVWKSAGLITDDDFKQRKMPLLEHVTADELEHLRLLREAKAVTAEDYDKCKTRVLNEVVPLK